MDRRIGASGHSIPHYRSNRSILRIGIESAEPIEHTGPLERDGYDVDGHIFEQRRDIFCTILCGKQQIHRKAASQKPKQMEHPQGSSSVTVGRRSRGQE